MPGSRRKFGTPAATPWGRKPTNEEDFGGKISEEDPGEEHDF
jgi:hypothetical protein